MCCLEKGWLLLRTTQISLASFRKSRPHEHCSIDSTCRDVWLPRTMQSASSPILLPVISNDSVSNCEVQGLSLPGFSVFLSWKWGLFPDIRIRGRVAKGPKRNSLYLVRGHNSLYLPPSASLGFAGLLEVLSLQSILIPLLIGHETVGWLYEGNVSILSVHLLGWKAETIQGRVGAPKPPIISSSGNFWQEGIRMGDMEKGCRY